MINDKNWQDSYLDRINIEFDKCLIELTDRSDRYRVIICYKFSSINYIGQYDEKCYKKYHSCRSFGTCAGNKKYSKEKIILIVFL